MSLRYSYAGISFIIDKYMSEQLLLQVKNLTVVLNNHPILKDISFEMKSQEVLAVIGPNGAGKTILLRTLIGLTPKASGEIIWSPEAKIGYLPQRFHVDGYLPMRVQEFLRLKSKTSRSLDEAMDLIQINKKLLNKNLANLSGGEMQKTLLIWTLLDKPNVLLFDEPTENVDVVGQQSIYTLLHHLQDVLGISIMIVSHDLQVVYRYANKVICLNQEMLCNGIPNEVLTTQMLSDLYGDHAFFHHHHFDHEGHHYHEHDH